MKGFNFSDVCCLYLLNFLFNIIKELQTKVGQKVTQLNAEVKEFVPSKKIHIPDK